MLSTLPEATFGGTREIVSRIAQTIERTHALSMDLSIQVDSLVVTGTAKRTPRPKPSRINLLDMAEGLIAAHRAAKEDDDGRTLDLIEDALFHVGQRLQYEYHGVVSER